ncbi:MAG: ABC transporter permease [Alphaproteobacteria bacterium]|nr:ABC transporter permease [Alphaproteobacteria bacterium]NCQ87662.1 ABC transporter permease [Alphaproteobacteria bacterium]NCT05829.1 ABC transporter permease [Alphaproteobacteria bacterium]
MPQHEKEFASQYAVVIKPRSFQGYWKEIWQFREILYILARRDIVVRYKQTIVGLLWTLIKPLLTMVAFTIVFSKIADLPSTGMPYPVLVLAGLLPWYFFSNTLGEMGNSIVNNQSMVSKIYFPRLLLPFSTISVGLIDLLIALVLLFVLMIFYGMAFSVTLLMLPFFMVFCALACIGPGLLFAGMNVKYRDVRIVIPFIIQFGLYISPVGFSSTLVSENLRMLYAINPMVSVIDGFRWCISAGQTPIFWPGFMVSFAVTAFMLVVGLWYFRRVDKTFADVI